MKKKLYNPIIYYRRQIFCAGLLLLLFGSR